MRKLLIILLSVLFYHVTFGQSNVKFIEGKGFNSVFQDEKFGEFTGTTNGVLFIKSESGKETILDFQGSYGKLNIVQDSDEIYDFSTKCYSGKTTSGNSEIRYNTYAMANCIGVKLNNEWFEINAIDGASDMVINGLNYYYKAETSTEYLVLTINKKIELSNWNHLLDNHTLNPDNIEDIKKKEKIIYLLPNSTIVFAIEKTQIITNILSIQKIFDNYGKHEETTDSPDNLNLMTTSLNALKIVTDKKELELLLNAWMYYDPTDFPARSLVYNVLKENKLESIIAVKNRIENKKEWENDDIAPYSDLNFLLQQLENE